MYDGKILNVSLTFNWHIHFITHLYVISVTYRGAHSSLVYSLAALARVSGGGELVRLREYGRSLGDGTCKTAGLDEFAVAEPLGWRSQPRWASGASNEPHNPCPEFTRVATRLLLCVTTFFEITIVCHYFFQNFYCVSLIFFEVTI